jgi:hypothetical protein
MVRRRSTVRFRKGAPQVRRVFVCLSEDLFRCREKVWRSTRKQNPRSGPVCRCLTDAGQFQSAEKISAMASLTGSFALTRERPPIRRPVPLGGKLGGKIVKRRAGRVVDASSRLALWSHLAGQVVTSAGGPRTRPAGAWRSVPSTLLCPALRSAGASPW